MTATPISESRRPPVGRIAVAVVAGTLACGIPLWPIPYSEVSMPGNPSGMVWLLGAAVAAGVAA